MRMLKEYLFFLFQLAKGNGYLKTMVTEQVLVQDEVLEMDNFFPAFQFHFRFNPLSHSYSNS